MSNNVITSKTPLGREATVGCGLLGPGRPRHPVTTGRNTRWNAPGRGITALTHLGASLDEMDVEIELSVSRNPRKHPSHHQTMTTPHSSKKRSQKAFRPVGRTPSAHFHSKRQPAVAIKQRPLAVKIVQTIVLLKLQFVLS